MSIQILQVSLTNLSWIALATVVLGASGVAASEGHPMGGMQGMLYASAYSGRWVDQRHRLVSPNDEQAEFAAFDVESSVSPGRVSGYVGRRADQPRRAPAYPAEEADLAALERGEAEAADGRPYSTGYVGRRVDQPRRLH